MPKETSAETVKSTGLLFLTLSSRGGEGIALCIRIIEGKRSAGGWLGRHEPNCVEALDEGYQRLKAKGFHKIRVGPDIVRAADIILQFGTGQDDDRQVAQFGVAADPLQDLKTSRARHFEVEQDERRQLVKLAVPINALAAQIGNGLLAIFDIVDRQRKVGFAHGRPQQSRV